jgi:hypothetical protein
LKQTQDFHSSKHLAAISNYGKIETVVSTISNRWFSLLSQSSGDAREGGADELEPTFKLSMNLVEWAIRNRTRQSEILMEPLFIQRSILTT